MLIESDATGTGSFLDQGGTLSVTGTTTAQRYTTGNWNGNWPPNTDIIWHYVASPTSSGTINSYMGGLLNWWDEAANTWQPLTIPTTLPLTVNKGYSAATTGNTAISFTGGTFNTGNQSITGLTNTDASDARGFNLLGNAYPSAVKWDGSVTLSNVDGALYLWNGSGYTTYIPGDAYEIPADQGFFVHVTTGQTSGTVTIPNSNRVHSSNGYVKSTTGERLGLTVNGNQMEDYTSIRFNSEATTGFDIMNDAYKLYGVSTCPQIYSIIPNYILSINSVPELTSQTIVEVGFKPSVTGSYTITASDLESFPAGTHIYLEDLVLGKTQDLSVNPVYTFDSPAGGPTHRFNVRFSPTTGTPDLNASAIRIYSTENSVCVSIPMDLHGTIIVYDLLGKTIASQAIQGNSLNKVNLNVETGYYLVKVFGDKATVSGKVFLR